jgi:magnesium transporter
MEPQTQTPPGVEPEEEEVTTVRLAKLLERRAPLDAALRLKKEPLDTAARVLERVNAVFAFKILQRMPQAKREALLPLINRRLGDQWLQNQRFPVGSIGRLMGAKGRTSLPTQTVAECVDELKQIAKTSFFTYVYVCEPDSRLVGVVTMRDLLLADPKQQLSEVMIHEPFHFKAETQVHDAAREVVHLHYPIYPVCDAEMKLIGLVRGYVLFEESAAELAGQAGRMVGVEGEERLSTPWTLSLKLRHPWLQLNLLMALGGAIVVGFYQDLIQEFVVLAVFLQVFSSQATNAGCQAMAITIRGMTLDEFVPGDLWRLMRKEAWLGLVNGAVVGFTAAGAMMLFANQTGDGHAIKLAVITMVAMAACCVLSGIAGVLVPHALKKFGADPSTASTIILTTVTDIVSMGSLLVGAALFLR